MDKLTREQMLAMTGRELDALVAEHVMGLEITPDGFKYEPRYYIPEYRKTLHRAVPDYSTDMGDAWKVVEKIRSDLKQYITIIDNPHLAYDVRFSGSESDIYFRLSNLSEAICKCALLAVMADG